MKQQGLAKGSIILLFATAISKIAGAVFKIPLTNILGGTGMGYFASAYGLFIPVYTAVSAGIPIALIRLVAKNCARGNYRTVRRLRKIALAAFLLVGIIGTVVILLLAKPFSVHTAKNPDCIYAVYCIAPSLIFCCLAAIERGYYEGMRNMYPTAVSQVTEGIVKTIAGLTLAVVAIKIGTHSFETNGTVFGRNVCSYKEAEEAVLPFAAAAAMLGSTISEIAGLLVIRIKNRIYGDGISMAELENSPPPEKSGALIRRIMKISVPLAAGALIAGLSSFVDIATIMRGLNNAIQANPSYFTERFASLELSELPNFLYGSYTGLTGSVISFVPIVASLLSKSALPDVSAVNEIKNKQMIKHDIESIMHATLLFSVPAGFGICVMSKQILTLLYPMRPDEAAVSAVPLAILGIGAVFTSILLPVTTMLCAVGKEKSVTLLMILSTALHLIFNELLISIPQINITGAAISGTLTNIIVVTIAMKILCKSVDAGLRFKRIFVIPFASAGACSALLAVMQMTLCSRVGWLCSVIIAGICAVLSYICLLFALKAIKKGSLGVFFRKNP